MAVQLRTLLMGHCGVDSCSRVSLGPISSDDAGWILWPSDRSALHRHRGKQRQVSALLSEDEPVGDQSSRRLGCSGRHGHWRLHVSAILDMVLDLRSPWRILRPVLSYRET